MGSGCESVVAIVEALRDAGVLVALTESNTRHDRRCPGILEIKSLNNMPIPRSSKTVQTSEHTHKVSRGAQIRDGRHVSSYQLSHCASPPQGLENPQQKARFNPWHGDASGRGELARPARDAYTSRSAIVWSDRLYYTAPQSTRGTDPFAESLRKYRSASPERSSSADLIQRLLIYTQAKNMNKTAPNSKSVRSLIRKSQDVTRDSSAYRRRTSPSPKRQDAKENTSPNTDTGTAGDRKTRGLLNSARSECRNVRDKDRHTNPNFDYLKSFSPQFCSKATEVRYLPDVTRYVRDALRQLYEEQAVVCPQIAGRYSQHRREHHRQDAQQQSSSDSVSTEVQTNCLLSRELSVNSPHDYIPSPETSSHVDEKLCCYCRKSLPCECKLSSKKLSFSCVKRVLSPTTCNYPLDQTEEDECPCSNIDVKKKIEDIVFKWLETVPVNANYTSKDKEMREEMANVLIDALTSITDDENFNEKVKVEALICLSDLPMWYPDSKIKELFKNQMADNLLDKLKELNYNFDKFCEVIVQWVRGLPLKSRNTKGQPVDRNQIAKDILERLKPVAIARATDDDEYKEALQSGIREILNETPLMNADKVKNFMTSLLADKLVGLPTSFYVPENPLEGQLLEIIQDIPEFIKLDGKNKKSIVKTLTNKFIDFQAQGVKGNEIKVKIIEAFFYYSEFLGEQDLEEQFKDEIKKWLDGIPELPNASYKKGNKQLMDKLAKTALDILSEDTDVDRKDVTAKEIKKILDSILDKEDADINNKTKSKLTGNLAAKLIETMKQAKTKGKKKLDLKGAFEKDITAWLDDISDLSYASEKTEVKSEMKKLAKELNELQAKGIDEEDTKDQMKNKAMYFLESTLDKEDIEMGKKAKHALADNLINTIVDTVKQAERKSKRRDSMSKSQVFHKEITGWLDEIPELPEASEKKENQQDIQKLAKKLVKLHADDADDEDIKEEMTDEISNFLDSTLEREGEEIDTKTKNKLSENLLNRLIKAAKEANKKNAKVMEPINIRFEKEIVKWLDNIPEVSEASGKKDTKSAIKKLATELENLHTEDLDEDAKEEMADKVKGFLSNTLEQEESHLAEKVQTSLTNILLEKLIEAGKEPKEDEDNSFESDITLWLNDIPDLSGDDKETRNMIKKLAKELQELKINGMDDIDVKEAMINKVKDFLETSLNREGSEMNSKEKHALAENLIKKLIKSSKQSDKKGKKGKGEPIKDLIEEEIVYWIKEIPEVSEAPEKKENKTVIKNLANELDTLQAERFDDEIKEEMTGKVQSFLDNLLKKEKAELNAKSKSVVTNKFMNKLGKLIQGAQRKGKSREDSDEGILEWLDEVPGMANSDDENEPKKKVKGKTQQVMSADVICKGPSDTILLQDFTEEVKDWFHKFPQLKGADKVDNKKMITKLARKILKPRFHIEDEDIRKEIEIEVKDWLENLYDMKHEELIEETKDDLTDNIITDIKTSLEDKYRKVRNADGTITYAPGNWESVKSVEKFIPKQNKKDSDKIKKRLEDDTTKTKKGATHKSGKATSSEEELFLADYSKNESSPPRKSTEITKFSDKASGSFNRGSYTIDNKNSTTGKKGRTVSSERSDFTRGKQEPGRRGKSLSPSGKSGTRNSEQESLYDDVSDTDKSKRRISSKSPQPKNSEIYYMKPINDSSRPKREQDKPVQKAGKSELGKRLSKTVNKASKRSISTIIQESVSKLHTPESESVKAEIVKVLKDKVGLPDDESVPLATNIIKKAKVVYKQAGRKQSGKINDADLEDLLRDEIKDILKETGINDIGRAIEDSLTNILADEIVRGRLNDNTKGSMYNVFQAADVPDEVAVNASQKLIDRAKRMSMNIPEAAGSSRKSMPAAEDGRRKSILNAMGGERKSFAGGERKSISIAQVVETKRISATSGHSRSPSLALTPMEKPMFLENAEREISAFVAERTGDVTPRSKQKIKQATEDLANDLGEIVSNPNATDDIKKETMKIEIAKFLQGVPLRTDEPIEELANLLANKLQGAAGNADTNRRKSMYFTPISMLGQPMSVGERQAFENEARKSIQEFVSEKTGDTTPRSKQKIDEAAEYLVGELGEIMINTNLTADEKQEAVKIDAANFLHQLPLNTDMPKEELATQLTYKLLNTGFKATDKSKRMSMSRPSMSASQKQALRDQAHQNILNFIEEKAGEITPRSKQTITKTTDTLVDGIEYMISDTNLSLEDKIVNLRKAIGECLEQLPIQRERSEEGMITQVMDLLPHTEILQDQTRRSSGSKRLSFDKDMVKEKAKLEITSFIDELTGELTPRAKEQIAEATGYLAELLGDIMADPNLSPEEKQEIIKSHIGQYMQQLGLPLDIPEEELVNLLMGRLETTAFKTSTPRVSLGSFTARRGTHDSIISSIGNEDNIIKNNEMHYTTQLCDIIQNWVSDLPIDLNALKDRDFRDTMVKDLATDIVDRQKYLQLNSDAKTCCDEELEHLKYQVFRRLNKVSDINDLGPFVTNIEVLMERIKRIQVPHLVKPSSKRIQDEILRWFDQMPPNMYLTCDRNYHQQMIRELSDRIQRRLGRPDSDAKIDTDIQQWLPKMLDINCSDLSNMTNYLKRTLKNKGLIDDKAEGSRPYRKAADVLYDIIVNWCKDLPIYSGDTPEEQERVETIKQNLASKLINKIGALNMNPEIFNDEFLYDDLLVDEIDKLLSAVPRNPELEKYLPALKRDFISKIKENKQHFRDELAGQAYKQQLRDAVTTSAYLPECLCPEELNSFEILKENLVDAFIGLHYAPDDDEDIKKYKKKIYDEINRFCNDYLRRHPMSPVDSKKLNQDLYSALQKVPVPKDDSMRSEVEQLRVKEVISDWVKELPMKRETGLELLQRNKMNSVLAKRLREMEKEKELNPCYDSEGNMLQEIVKWLRRNPLRYGHECEIPRMAEKLITYLRNTEQSRIFNASKSACLSMSQDDCFCTPCFPPSVPPCTLSISDRAHMQRIRDRVHTRSPRFKESYADLKDCGSQTQVKPWCNVGTSNWNRTASPNMRQSASTQADPYCCMTPSQSPYEISPQIIVKEYAWESPHTSKMHDSGYQLKTCPTAQPSCRNQRPCMPPFPAHEPYCAKPVTSPQFVTPKTSTCKCHPQSQESDKPQACGSQKSPETFVIEGEACFRSPDHSSEDCEVGRTCRRPNARRECTQDAPPDGNDCKRSKWKKSQPKPSEEESEWNSLRFPDDNDFWHSWHDKPADSEPFTERERREEKMRCRCKETVVSSRGRQDRSSREQSCDDALKQCSKNCGVNCPYPSYLYFR